MLVPGATDIFQTIEVLDEFIGFSEAIREEGNVRNIEVVRNFGWFHKNICLKRGLWKCQDEIDGVTVPVIDNYKGKH